MMPPVLPKAFSGLLKIAQKYEKHNLNAKMVFPTF